MAKPKKNADRRARVEQMRREQQRKERRQGLLIVGSAVLVGAIIVGVAVWQIVQAGDESQSALAEYGVPADEAGCQEIEVQEAVEGASDHRAEGAPIEYDASPPAAGPHWPQFLVGNQIRPFWTTDDRPPVERLVHSLEHGHTIAWYDQDLDEESVEELERLAEEAAESNDTEGRFMAAPWTEEDGEAFPEGTDVVLTHWSVGGDGDPSGEQQGIRQFCAEVSGEVVQDFIAEYPYTDAPEPGAA